MAAGVVPDIHGELLRVPLPSERVLRTAVAQAASLAGHALARARAVALDQLGDIDLPPAVPSTPDDQAQIRAMAPLYLAAQLEEAGLVPAVEMLSGLAFSGGLPVNLRAASSLIETFWRQRNERFHENERRAFFTRLFGADDAATLSGAHDERTALNAVFEDLMINLCESLYKLDEQSMGGQDATPQAQAGILIAARNLAENLVSKGGGMTAFAAKEILATIQMAILILQQPAVQHAFGAQSLWAVVQAVSSRYLHVVADSPAYVMRGKSGLILLSWLADSLPQLNGEVPLVTLDHPVIGAATEWLQASLTIREAGSQAGG